MTTDHIDSIVTPAAPAGPPADEVFALAGRLCAELAARIDEWTATSDQRGPLPPRVWDTAEDLILLAGRCADVFFSGGRFAFLHAVGRFALALREFATPRIGASVGTLRDWRLLRSAPSSLLAAADSLAAAGPSLTEAQPLEIVRETPLETLDQLIHQGVPPRQICVIYGWTQDDGSPDLALLDAAKRGEIAPPRKIVRPTPAVDQRALSRALADIAALAGAVAAFRRERDGDPEAEVSYE